MAQVRWKLKLVPNKSQVLTVEEWLVTLRIQYNINLRQRESGYTYNNVDEINPVKYEYGSFCDLTTKIEYGSSCPLTCGILKHGVVPDDLSKATKVTKEKVDTQTGTVIKPSELKWDDACGIQMKLLPQIKEKNRFVASVNSTVLQSNITRLDDAYIHIF